MSEVDILSLLGPQLNRSIITNWIADERIHKRHHEWMVWVQDREIWLWVDAFYLRIPMKMNPLIIEKFLVGHMNGNQVRYVIQTIQVLRKRLS